MRLRSASPFIAILAITLFPACTNVRDLGEGNSAYGMREMNLDLDSVLIGQAGSFRDVNHPAEAQVYNESYGDYRSAYVQLDVYDNDRWAMANLQFDGASFTDLQPGQTYRFDAGTSDDVNVYGIGCSSTSSDAFDEEFTTVEVTAIEDGDEIVIDFQGQYANGDELAGSFPANTAEGGMY